MPNRVPPAEKPENVAPVTVLDTNSSPFRPKIYTVSAGASSPTSNAAQRPAFDTEIEFPGSSFL